MKIKSLLITAVLATAILCCGVANVHAAKATTAADCLSVVGGTNYTTDERISCLQDLITQLMAQIKNLQSQQGTTQAWCHTFNNYLVAGSTGSEVDDLWTALGKDNPIIAPSLSYDHEGMGQPDTFGENTAAAVVQFQGKYGIMQTGTVGPITRAKLNALYRCGTTPACSNLYWFDNTSSNSCQTPKQFCGTYMYYGLQTFGNQQDCLNAFNLARGNCTPNWTCSWGPCKNGWQSYVITDSNNCGLSAPNVNIACPALAQQCPIQSSINVLSPNGGETWQKGTIQKIKWQDNIPIPECPPDAYCAQVARFYDIKLTQPRPYCPPCVAGAACAACSIQAPYTIATSVSGYSYSWGVGKILSNYLSTPAPDGAYIVQICQTGTDICDSSDSYFKIIDFPTTNLPPVISGVTAPTILSVNQTGTWTINASDPENGPLNYSVNWGDAIIAPISYSASAQSAFIQTSTFTHSYSSAGIYTVTFTVMDNAGQTAQTSSTVQVGYNCPAVQCILDSCPGNHSPDTNGCVNCSTPCYP